MEESWRALLARLVLTDADVFREVARTCRTQARFRYSPSDVQIGTVYSDVVVCMCRRYQAEPNLVYFTRDFLFLAAVRTAATQSYDPVEAPRRRRRDVLFGLPDEVPEPAAPVERPARDLDCPRMCERCLSDGNDRQRGIFLAMCEGVRQHGHLPKYDTLVPRLGRNKTDVCRLWKETCSRIRRSACGDPITFLDGV